jgi:hypothetical protein
LMLYGPLFWLDQGLDIFCINEQRTGDTKANNK